MFSWIYSKFFDEFESRDLGCAVGGGANATDVFQVSKMIENFNKSIYVLYTP